MAQMPVQKQAVNADMTLEVAIDDICHGVAKLPSRNARQKAKRRVKKKARDTFRFTELPAEIRVEMYRLVVNYESIYRIARKMHSKVKDLDPRIHRTEELRGMAASTFSLKTPSLLLVNKQVHGEAVAELRRKPLVFDTAILWCCRTFHLTFLEDIMPLRTFAKLHHIHFDVAEFQVRSAVELLWGGGKDAAPDGFGFRGLLSGDKDQPKPSLQKVSFETLCKTPKELVLPQIHHLSEFRALCRTAPSERTEHLKSLLWKHGKASIGYDNGNRHLDAMKWRYA